MKFNFFCLNTKYFSFKQAENLLDTYIVSLLLLTIFLTTIVLGIRRFSGLQALELLTYDWMVNLQSKNATDPRLLVVE
jgi:CHASE2 domain-containing sensor protein